MKNKDDTSTEVYAPINKTGVYTVLVHTTLFGGESVAEPVTVMAKFSTILPSEKPPTIELQVPQFVNGTYRIIPKITGSGIQGEMYSIDSSPPEAITNGTFPNATAGLPEGQHILRIMASDSVGHSASRCFGFVLDRSPPVISFESPANGSTVSGMVQVRLGISEANPVERGWLDVILPDNRTVSDNSTFQYDTRVLQNGVHQIEAVAKDKAGNTADQRITVFVNNHGQGSGQGARDQNFITLVELLVGIATAAAISLISFKYFRISKIS